MYSIVSTAVLHGIGSIPVCVEADVSEGMPIFDMIGFLASEVREARERVRTALRNSGYRLPPSHVTINFTPADIRKSGSGFDLPVSAAVLAALGVIHQEALEGTFVTGEVGLNGRVQPVRGVFPMIAEAKERGLRRCVVPEENRREAYMVEGMTVYAVSCIREMVGLLNGDGGKDADGSFNIEGTCDVESEGAQAETLPDFSEISGQPFIRRACETAVSGMHNLLLTGPPGAGKTMMAMRIPSILPPLDHAEQMELSRLYSVSGLLAGRDTLIRERPFRAPHHTVTAQGLAGGGVHPKLGEISLAHKGVLFLDELPEFKKETLEVLRQPLEEKKVRLVRLLESCEYPADFMLVAAMNPCRCGYYPDVSRCRCTALSVERYLGKISRPLLDRIDICVMVPQLTFRELLEGGAEESSADIRRRVLEAQQRQKERYRNEIFSFNSQIPAAKIREYCGLNRKQESDMEEAYRKFELTARSYHRILKVARTLADMDGHRKILDRHLGEAVCYRSPEQKCFGNLWGGGGD